MGHCRTCHLGFHLRRLQILRRGPGNREIHHSLLEGCSLLLLSRSCWGAAFWIPSLLSGTGSLSAPAYPPPDALLYLLSPFSSTCPPLRLLHVSLKTTISFQFSRPPIPPKSLDYNSLNPKTCSSRYDSNSRSTSSVCRHHPHSRPRRLLLGTYHLRLPSCRNKIVAINPSPPLLPNHTQQSPSLVYLTLFLPRRTTFTYSVFFSRNVIDISLHRNPPLHAREISHSVTLPLQFPPFLK